MGFAELIFTSLIRISAINPKSKHYVTFATPRVVPVRRAKAFICRKVVPLARVTLPAEVRQLAHPRRVRDPNVNGWLNFRKKQAKCYLGQGSSGGGGGGGGVVSGTRDHITGPFRLDHGVTKARCLFVAGITLHSLAPFTWNKSKKRLWLVKLIKMVNLVRL